MHCSELLKVYNTYCFIINKKEIESVLLKTFANVTDFETPAE